MVVLSYIALLILLLLGLLMDVLTLPGNWIMLLGFVGFDSLTRSGHMVRWEWIAVLFALAASGELFDILGSGAGAKKAGASVLATLGALLGGLLGAIFLSFVLFFPLGTIAGACIGCFIGAGAVELLVRGDVGQSVRVGFFAARGRLIGLVVKIIVGLAMAGLAAWAALPLPTSQHAVPASLTAPRR
jgi:uncharacterized protein YqgC (DUF456 family)